MTDEGVASDLLEFSNAAVTAPLLTADPKLLKALKPFCDMAAKERRTPSDTLRAAVEKEAETPATARHKSKPLQERSV